MYLGSRSRHHPQELEEYETRLLRAGCHPLGEAGHLRGAQAAQVDGSWARDVKHDEVVADLQAIATPQKSIQAESPQKPHQPRDPRKPLEPREPREPPPAQPIPDLYDRSAPRPAKNTLTLSPEAVRARTRRIFTPRTNGSLKVSQLVWDEWNKGKNSKERKNLELIFQACGYDPDASIKKV